MNKYILINNTVFGKKYFVGKRSKNSPERWSTEIKDAKRFYDLEELEDYIIKNDIICNIEVI